MDLNALRDYSNWIGKSAEEVLAAVKRVGGWAVVFPYSVPLWAHRVRNFFNLEPTILTRYDEDFSRNFLGRVQEGLNALDRARKIKWLKKHPVFRELPEVKKMPEPPPGTPDLSIGDDIGETFALSDYVYKDDFKNIWFQMSPSATIYHWGRDPIVPEVEALGQLGAQAAIPIFKLVSPDGSGGSRETIIRNTPDRMVKIMGHSIKIGRICIGEVNRLEPVSRLIVTDEWHQGSYNYSETVDVGLAAHERRDVKPHAKYPYPGVYVNPPNRHSPLALRHFPAKGASNERNPLAKQV